MEIIRIGTERGTTWFSGGTRGGGVFISVLQGDHRKLTTEEGDH